MFESGDSCWYEIEGQRGKALQWKKAAFTLKKDAF